MKVKYAAAVLLSLGMSASAYAQPANLGFETGDTAGWNESYPPDIGSIDVVTEWTGQSTLAGASGRWTVTYEPVKGNYFAVLETGAPTGHFTTLSQKFDLNRGETLEGWATFCCGSEVYQPYLPIDAENYNDYALINILNSQGNVVDVPWYADSFDIGHYVTTPEGESTGEVVDFGPLPWKHWSWTAPAPDSYTLQYKTTQVADVIGISYALFDGPGDKSTSVPEPATMAMLGLVFGGIAFTRRIFA